MSMASAYGYGWYDPTTDSGYLYPHMGFVPSSRSSGSETYATTSTPEVLFLKEFLARGEEDDGLFQDIYGPLKANIKARYRSQKKRCGKAARSMLTERKPRVILSVDAGLLGRRKSYIDFQFELVKYVRSGGTLILACLFSGNASPDLHDALLARFELPWKYGDYHRSTFFRNPAFRDVLGPQLYNSLEESYSMKTLHLKHVPIDERLYSPGVSSTTQSAVFPASAVDLHQCPAAFAKCGRGYIGYIGDVNNEVGSQKLLMAMLGKSSSTFWFPPPDRIWIIHSRVSALRADLQILCSETAISSYEVRTGNQTPIPLELNRILEAQSSRQQSEPVDPDMPALINGCLVCGALRPVKKCGRCTTAQYCSADCQKKDWKDHKTVCDWLGE